MFFTAVFISQVHTLIVSYLKSQMPTFGKDSRKKDLIKNLDSVFRTLQTDHDIPAADFPDPVAVAEKLKKQDFTKLPNYDKAAIERVDKMLCEDFPRLMKLIPAEEAEKSSKGKSTIKGGIFDKVSMPCGTGIQAGIGEKIWIVSR